MPETQPAQQGYKRKTLLINKKLQITLIAYMIGLAAMSSFLTIAFVQILIISPMMSSPVGAVFMVATLSIVLVSAWGLAIMVYTNKIFGPIFRLQRELKNWRDGGPVTAINLRKGDQFTDLIDDFNAVATKR
jgi:hypothetical protein